MTQTTAINHHDMGTGRGIVPSIPLDETTLTHRKHKHHLPAVYFGILFVCCIFAYHETIMNN